ncbi:hypothetical protein [Duganella sp. CF517]|uniref:hypothetical protein n=1 Tax=Duganella sp. CF517 TaxID=1881038 RepID=UPI001E4AFB7C|nr:hypothetical protein [Duganella sp. CF517]
MLAASACGSAPSATPAAPAPGAPTATQTEALWKKIQAANADTSCDTQSQCHTIGFGSKACGGPERYLAWSSKNSDGAALKALIEQHAAARRADDQREQMMSTCSLVSDPGASCRAGRCTINPTAPGSGTDPRRAD